MNFRIYISDGNSVEFYDAVDWPEIPVGVNCQIIAEVYEGHKYVHMGGDHFLWNGEHWRCTADKVREGVYLDGLLISDVAFEQIKKLAFKWIMQQAS